MFFIFFKNQNRFSMSTDVIFFIPQMLPHISWVTDSCLLCEQRLLPPGAGVFKQRWGARYRREEFTGPLGSEEPGNSPGSEYRDVSDNMSNPRVDPKGTSIHLSVRVMWFIIVTAGENCVSRSLFFLENDSRIRNVRTLSFVCQLATNVLVQVVDMGLPGINVCCFETCILIPLVSLTLSSLWGHSYSHCYVSALNCCCESWSSLC